ncbi:MAG: hypothetical protein ACTS5V_11240, partial [Giesbergeria sp.]
MHHTTADNAHTVRPWRRLRAVATATLAGGFALALGGCATRINTHPTQNNAPLQLQNRLLLTPTNGGQSITAAQLQPGDLILSSANGLVS